MSSPRSGSLVDADGNVDMDVSMRYFEVGSFYSPPATPQDLLIGVRVDKDESLTGHPSRLVPVCCSLENP